MVLWLPGPAELMAHPRRRHILRVISERPGIHLRALGRECGIGLGALRFHLGPMARQGLIRSRRSGRRRIYFPATYRGPAGRSRRERLLEEIERSPGLSVSELAADQDCSRMLVHYHLHRLSERRLVETRRIGARLVVYPSRRRAPRAVEPALRRAPASESGAAARERRWRGEHYGRT